MAVNVLGLGGSRKVRTGGLGWMTRYGAGLTGGGVSCINYQ